MHHYVLLLCSSLLLSCFPAVTLCAEEREEAIHWHTAFEEALNKAKQNNKPLLLFFTGSDWCGWCIKLEKEALDTKEFASEAAKRFIFVKLDFPLYKSIPSDLSVQNKALQKRWDVRGFPTIVLLDSNQNQIGQVGYRSGGGKQYAQHLVRMVEEYSGYKSQMSQLGQVKLPIEQLKQLYYKAKELSLYHEGCRIIVEGMASEQPDFFAMERYRLLAEEGKIHGIEATQLRRFLLEHDPLNEKMTHYSLALIDFETFSAEMEKESYAPELTVAPLVSYIERFGGKDHDNMWQLQLIISQVFLDKNRLDKALYYAQSSLDTAPPALRSQIATAVQSIRAQMTH